MRTDKLLILTLVTGTLASILGACAAEVVQHNNAGNDRYSDGAYDSAISEYHQAQLSDPDRAEPYYNAANAHNRQAQLDASKSQAQQALKNAGPDLAAKTWYNLGNTLFDTGAWPEAVSAYQEALRIDPNDLDAKHNHELALKEIEQQSGQKERQSNQDEGDASSDGGEDSEMGTPTPSPTGESKPSDDSDDASSASSDEATAKEDLTQEQALQLIRALVQDAETLQERLQEVYKVPGPPPEQDW